MKKIIALVLAALLALSMVAALAAEYKDKATVKQVQQALNDAGYDCGTPDGSAGKKTKNAIKAYQADNGMAETGVVDDALLAAMNIPVPETQNEKKGKKANSGASDAALQEITFQDIPWGATPDEAKAILTKAGMIKGSDFYYSDTTWTDFWSEHTFAHGFLNDVEFLRLEDIGGKTYLKPTKSIGGLEVEGLNLNYLYTVEDGVLDRTPRLVMVQATLIGGEPEFKDLSEKLSDKYGKYTEIKDRSWFNTKVRFWKGSDNTGIALVDQLVEGQLFLYYGKTDAADSVKDIQDAVEAERQAKVAGMDDAGL